MPSLPYASRLAQAQAYCDAGEVRVKTTPEPKGQKFPCGSRVRICKDLGSMMSHFKADRDATVKYTYAHAFRGDNIKSYWLDIDDHGECGWYQEWQLTLLEESK